jgi:hypothetical protein
MQSLEQIQNRGYILPKELDWLIAESMSEACCVYCGTMKGCIAIKAGGKDVLICLTCYGAVFADKDVEGLDVLKEWWL